MAGPGASLRRGHDVKPRVLWWLVYLVPVVAGCDCSWRWVSGAQVASCSAGGSHPDGGVWPGGARTSGPTRRWRARAASMSSQGPWLRISSALYSELSASARAKPKGIPLRASRRDCLAVGQGLPVADGPVLHPTVVSGAPDPSGQYRLVSAARRPFSGRPGPGRCTGRWRFASPRFAARRHR